MGIGQALPGRGGRRLLVVNDVRRVIPHLHEASVSLRFELVGRVDALVKQVALVAFPSCTEKRGRNATMSNNKAMLNTLRAHTIARTQPRCAHNP